MKWFAGTVSLTSLMTGFAFILFVSAAWLSDAVICHYWHGDDDWLWLTLPIGGATGLALGLRFAAHKWLHVVSTVVGLLTIAFPVVLFVAARAQSPGLAAGLGGLLSLFFGLVALCTVGVSFVVASIIRALIHWHHKTGSSGR